MKLVLHMDIEGTGRPIVFLHGCPTTPDVLSSIAKAVAARAQSIQVHLPGYGKSAPLVAPWTLEQQLDTIEASLTERGIFEATLVGYSGGTYLAFALASRGFRARSIVSLAGLASYDDAQRTGFRSLAKDLRKGLSLRPVARNLFLSPSSVAHHEDRVRAVEGWVDATSPENLANELEAFADAPDLVPGLATVGCPVLARVGALDAAVPVAKSEAIVRAVPRGVLQVVPDVGHALTLEDEAETTASVVQFLASV